MTTLLVTGGCGFIGTNLVRALLDKDYSVVTLDAATYSAAPGTLAEMQKLPRHELVIGSILDRRLIEQLLHKHKPAAILNLAAASHVDRSIDGPGEFIETNIVGVYELLEAVRTFLPSLHEDERNSFRFLQVSTDEVYGSIEIGQCDEESTHRPSSPYAASKAAADDLVRAWATTFGIPTIITNCTNNYGPYQFPEKLIPHMLLRALDNQALPLYGDGQQRRDWLYVTDHADALISALENGRTGESYNISGNCEATNIEIVTQLCSTLDQFLPRPDRRAYADAIEFVDDRPGHDRRYALDSSKLSRELGASPKVGLRDGLERTVKWYLSNEDWCRQILSDSYNLERIGKI